MRDKAEGFQDRQVRRYMAYSKSELKYRFAEWRKESAKVSVHGNA